MTPYIVTVKRENRWIGARSDSRRAVATLDEAREAVFLHAHRANADAGNALAEITESGGTSGPLPDGTVIEVEPTTVAALLAELSSGAVPANDDARIIAAYNEAQA